MRVSRLQQRSFKKGFTLVELMFATLIGGMVLTATTLTINLWARSAVGVGNYSDMSATCRRALDRFASDVRMANKVTVSTDSTFTFTAFDDSNGTVSVSYVFDNTTDELTRTYDGVTQTLLRDVDRFVFAYFDLKRDSTTNPLSVKEVQIESLLTKQLLNISNTDEIISARFMLRNRRVSS